MKQRIIGFDLARTYAIFGMFIVNFNMVFGSYKDQTTIGNFLSLFNGNSSTVFVILAGMGVALMTSRSVYSIEEKIKLKITILKRALFLFIAGLLLNFIWPADILHFYGCYMFISAFLIFQNKRIFLWLAALSILIFHSLVFIIPYETGWNIEKFQYEDLYTINGFVRNTFYNGWNSIFPWISYFFLGMFLGRLDWTQIKVQRKMFLVGLFLYSMVNIFQLLFQHASISAELREFMYADYLPPFLPFILSTFGFGLMLISAFMYVGNKIGESQLAKSFALTGQMTLTHYVSHVTIGMILFSMMEGKNLTDNTTDLQPTKPIYILLFSIIYFVVSYYLSKLWAKKFKNGPLEMIMRKISS